MIHGVLYVGAPARSIDCTSRQRSIRSTFTSEALTSVPIVEAPACLDRSNTWTFFSLAQFAAVFMHLKRYQKSSSVIARATAVCLNAVL